MNRLNDQILEEFITQHREVLDIFEPPAEMWQKISGELDENPVVMDDASNIFTLNTKEEVLENFVSQNQSALDIFEPPTELWQKISGELGQTSEEQVLEDFVLDHKNELDIFEPPADAWQKIASGLEGELDNQEPLLEQFISEHREALQLFEPPTDTWQRVSTVLDKEKPSKVITLSYRSLVKYSSVAAAIVLVGFIGLKLWGGKGEAANTIAKTKDTTSLAKTLATIDDMSLTELDPELAEAESYYTELIAEKQKELEKYSLDDLSLKEEFKGDISELDSTYNSLKKELYNVPSKEKVSEAMILNLQTRIEILNQQLKILEKTKKKKKSKKNEKMDI